MQFTLHSLTGQKRDFENFKGYKRGYREVTVINYVNLLFLLLIFSIIEDKLQYKTFNSIQNSLF